MIMKNMPFKLSAAPIFLLLVAGLLMNCGGPGEVISRPEPPAEPTEPAFMLKPFHYSMMDRMQQAFEEADEIILGVYTGMTKDKIKGPTYFFDGFRSFDKESQTWGPQQDVLLTINLLGLKPEIIKKGEYRNMPHVDRIGICWDVLDGKRYFYLVEGQNNLIFVKHELDENGQELFRFLVDTYPSIKECSSKDLFDLMLKERSAPTPHK